MLSVTYNIKVIVYTTDSARFRAYYILKRNKKCTQISLVILRTIIFYLCELNMKIYLSKYK